jgi:hypothetical protein
MARPAGGVGTSASTPGLGVGSCASVVWLLARVKLDVLRQGAVNLRNKHLIQAYG